MNLCDIDVYRLMRDLKIANCPALRERTYPGTISQLTLSLPASVSRLGNF